MADVFISYSREDAGTARQIATALGERGYTVWWDRKIPPGRSFDEVIGEALADAKCVVVLWTRSSVESNWVIAESSEAFKHKALVPAFLEKVEQDGRRR